jgi:hypothetical protein
MASVGKYRDGYRAQVFVKGQRDSKTFRTKREASSWAAIREVELREESAKPVAEKKTLLDAMRRYARDESPKKRGARWERIRLAAFESILPAHLSLAEVTPEMLAKWRDDRLKVVKPGSVIRDIGLLSAVLDIARREWKWIEVNPLSDVRRPR